MSVTLNLEQKKLTCPSNFFTDQILVSKEIKLNSEDSLLNMFNIKYILSSVLYKVRDSSSDKPSDINIYTSTIKGLIMKKRIVKKLTSNFNEESSKSFLNVLLFEGNNTFVCYIYYSNNFTYPNLNIIGTPEKIYVLLFNQDEKRSIYNDSISIDNDNLYYQSEINCSVFSKTECLKTECPKNECPKNECPLQSCPQCPDTKPYFHALLVCGIIIFCMTLFFIYNFTKENKKIKENILEK